MTPPRNAHLAKADRNQAMLHARQVERLSYQAIATRYHLSQQVAEKIVKRELARTPSPEARRT